MRLDFQALQALCLIQAKGLANIKEDKYFDIRSSKKLNITGNLNFQSLNSLANSTSNFKTPLLPKSQKKSQSRD